MAIDLGGPRFPAVRSWAAYVAAKRARQGDGIHVNNGMPATIRMHQERNFPGREFAKKLNNPDFVALAKSFGAHTERVEHTEDFAPAFQRASSCGRVALIELRVDPRQITPQARLP